MADSSIITDDEYASPDEFNDAIVRDLHKKIGELTKQLEDMKIERDEAHKYINDMSAKLASHGELEKEVKRLKILNLDLESRLQAEDKAYVKLWKEVSPSKESGGIGKKDPATSSKDPKKKIDKSASDTSKKTSKSAKRNEYEGVTATASVGELIQELRNKEGRIHELEISLKEISKTKEKYKRTLEKLREEKQALNEDTSRQLTQRDNKICKTEENLRLMTARKDDLEKDLKRTKEELDSTAKHRIEDNQGPKSTLTEDGKAMSFEIESLKREVDTLRRELVTTSAKCKEMLSKNEELKKLLEENESKQVTKDDEVHALKMKNGKQEEMLRKKDSVKAARNDELRVLDLKNEELDKLLTEKECITVTKDDEVHALETTNGKQEEMLKEKDSVKDILNDSQVFFDSLTVQPARTKKIIEIRLRSLRSGMGKAMLDGVTKGLHRLLQDRLLREKIDPHIKPCQALDDATDGPLFILCLAKSIVGTKVNALEGIEGNKDTFLIIIHYTEEEESLLMSNPSFRLYGTQLRPLGGTIDMIYSVARGLSDCDVNNSAVERMTTFLKKY